jgi:hypothetical protein
MTLFNDADICLGYAAMNGNFELLMRKCQRSMPIFQYKNLSGTVSNFRTNNVTLYMPTTKQVCESRC